LACDRYVRALMVYRSIVFFYSLALVATSVTAQPELKTRAIASIKALAAATTDALRDSLNAVLKTDMRALLDNDESFGRNYDSLPMSRVDAPDHAFRLFTWNVPHDDGTHLFEGFLLVNAGNKQQLFELRDWTKGTPSPEIRELGPDKWYGALYYQVIPVKKGGTTYYTLLGWKGFSNTETRKVIDVLSFKNGKPRFGAPFFGKGRLKQVRKIYAYSAQSTMSLRYMPEMEAILLDHLSPSKPDMVGQPAFYGPDMTQDAFFWYKGGWWYEEDIDAKDPKANTKIFNAPRRGVKP
jgi:hypothetical protein